MTLRQFWEKVISQKLGGQIHRMELGMVHILVKQGLVQGEAMGNRMGEGGQCWSRSL